MSTEVTRRDEITELQRLGKMFAASGYFQDVKDLAQACVKIQAGKEMGFPPIASMTGVYVVKGRVSLSANLMASALLRCGYSYRVLRLENDGCAIEFFSREKQSLGVSKFDAKDAATAQLGQGENWKKYPRNMFFARAMSNGVRFFAPDVFGGSPVYTPEELGASVEEDGRPILETESRPALTNGNGAAAEVVFTAGTKPQSDATAALQEKLDAKRKAAGVKKPDAEIEKAVSPLPETYPGSETFSDEDVDGLC
jgi:hypothetical protein